jgi:hypothetical protein
MAQDTRKVMTPAESERERLGLHEFESRMMDAAKPRNWFDENPAVFLGAAAAAGVLLGLLIEPSATRPQAGFAAPSLAKTSGNGVHRPAVETMRETVNTTLEALVVLGAKKIQDFVATSLPGFYEQYEQTQRQRADKGSADVL